jgi:hypothetical protein
MLNIAGFAKVELLIMFSGNEPNNLELQIVLIVGHITFFKGGPADPLLQEKEHPTTSKIHATLDSCPL